MWLWELAFAPMAQQTIETVWEASRMEAFKLLAKNSLGQCRAQAVCDQS